jgi:alkylated DNA repair dioxygenase AlkB
MKKEEFPAKAEGLFRYTDVFSDDELKSLNEEVLNVISLGKNGKLLNNDVTFNRTEKRIQINFGYYYSYGFDKEKSILRRSSKNKISFTRADSKGVQPVQMEKNIYGKEVAVPVEPMPFWLNNLIKKLIDSNIISVDEMYNSALINVYSKGGAIYPHVDDFPSFERNIATIRLLNPTVMSFGYTGADNLKNAKKQKKSFRMNLPVGSVVIMSKESAEKITHAIMQEDSIHEMSVSITLRKIKPEYLPNVYKSYVDKM